MKRAAVAVAVLAVAVVTFLIVGRNSTPDPLQVTARGTHYAATVSIDQPTTGRVVVDVRLTSGDADDAALSAVMPTMGHAMPEITAREPEPGHFVAEGEFFPMTGVWELSIRLTGPAGEEVLTVNAPITG
ncbi:hypothetical protein ACIBO2_43585 [Nonomuraea sp. NPDC050022]|uniref:hypothetical protein n=1 Tax=Nonomuraea sp. NPDC050022 TaxID=3364358 RepID=UPI00378ACC29